MPAEQEAALDAELTAFEKATGHQFVVVTIPDLGDIPNEDYAFRLGRHWGIGRKGADDGIILLQSPGDGSPGSGKIRIEIGKGMEYILTDAESGRIIRSEEHTSELQSLMRISYAVFCLKKKNITINNNTKKQQTAT